MPFVLHIDEWYLQFVLWMERFKYQDNVIKGLQVKEDGKNYNQVFKPQFSFSQCVLVCFEGISVVVYSWVP